MRVGARDLLFLSVVSGGLATIGAGLFRPFAATSTRRSGDQGIRPDVQRVVSAVDMAFRRRWADEKLVPAAEADELAVMRRVALALVGTIPSLEEVRRFEARPKHARLEAWLDDVLRDRRFADYLAERFGAPMSASRTGLSCCTVAAA